MPHALSLFAGPTARAMILEQGLSPEDITAVTGAAGGPKWLVVCGLDRAIFGSFLRTTSHPINLVGASAGAWRFAALAQGTPTDPLGAYDRFEEAYITQDYTVYPGGPTARDVTGEGVRILDAFFQENGTENILTHPIYRLSVLTVMSLGLTRSDSTRILGPAMLLAGAASMISRNLLGCFFHRAVFHDRRSTHLFLGSNGFSDTIPTVTIALTEQNLRPAVLASGSIPVVMEGITDIPDAPDGTYRDGGLLDYHVTIPGIDSSIILFPHYIDRIIPGWFDKYHPRRTPSQSHLERLLMLCPSKEFVSRFPHEKIPDRKDFRRFIEKDEERIAYWRRVVSECSRLGDEFLELVETGRIKDRIQPL